MKGPRSLVLAAGVFAALGGAPLAGAESIRVDAVGVAPAGPNAREAALASGVREAVLLVAGELAREGGASATDPVVLEEALGPDLRSYAGQYRLAEDRGERPAQLVQQPGVEREYAVVVEAHVDRERVRAALLRAGLLGPVAASGVHSLWLTVEGVQAWPTWERVRRTLAARGGAVRPIEFARGVVIAELQTDESNEAVVERLRRALGETLGISVTESAPGTLRLRVVTAAAPELDVPGAGTPLAPLSPPAP